jgi:hypothetical protein
MENEKLQIQMPRPKVVEIAGTLYWIALAIGFVKSFFFAQAALAKNPVFFVIIFGGVFAVMWFLMREVQCGYNAVRILMLVLTIFGLPSYVSLVRKEFVDSVLLGSMSISQFLLQLTTFILLFTPQANAWFKLKRR